MEADIIIFSSGTQWSSLIPTYLHHGFHPISLVVPQGPIQIRNEDIFWECHAAKYLVMNNIEDHDMYGISADGLLNILDKFLDLEDIGY